MIDELIILFLLIQQVLIQRLIFVSQSAHQDLHLLIVDSIDLFGLFEVFLDLMEFFPVFFDLGHFDLELFLLLVDFDVTLLQHTSDKEHSVTNLAYITPSCSFWELASLKTTLGTES